MRLEVRPYALERLGVGNEIAVNVLVDREDVRTRAEVPLSEVHAERQRIDKEVSSKRGARGEGDEG